MFEAVVIIIILAATGILFIPFYRDNGFRVYDEQQQYIPKVAALLGSREHMLNRLADLRGDMDSGKLSPDDFHASRLETVTVLKEIDAQLVELESSTFAPSPAMPNDGPTVSSKAEPGQAGAQGTQSAVPTHQAQPSSSLAPSGIDSTSTTQRARFCAACGHGLKEHFKFCPSCGEKVEL